MTNKTTEALKLAENTLRDIIRVYKFEGGTPVTALATISEALAEQEKQEPVATDLMDMLRLIETIKYLRGIAERGLGREIREDETIEQFVLGYVKQLEATQPVKQEPVAWLNPHNQAVIDARKKKQIGEGKGYPNFSIPLYAAPVSVEAAVLAEREACAEVCDRFAENEAGFVAEDCAAAIRARGEK